MRSAEVCDCARGLLERADDETSAFWARGCAVLTRYAIERGTAEILALRAPSAVASSMRTQLLCLDLVLNGDPLARRVAYSWGALSRACHYHPYELTPAATELLRYLEDAEALAARAAETAETVSERRADRRTREAS